MVEVYLLHVGTLFKKRCVFQVQKVADWCMLCVCVCVCARASLTEGKLSIPAFPSLVFSRLNFGGEFDATELAWSWRNFEK